MNHVPALTATIFILTSNGIDNQYVPLVSQWSNPCKIKWKYTPLFENSFLALQISPELF